MKIKTSFQDKRSGMTLFVVMGMTLLCTMAVSSVLFSVNARMRRAYKQVDFEKAFYIAEAGLERVAAVVATGNEVEQPYRGNIDGGEYEAKPAGRRLFGNEKEIVIKSVGRYRGTECKVAMYGVRGVSWARYALWYKSEDPKGLWFIESESFKGRVYSEPKMKFKGKTHFYDRVWTVPDSISYPTGKKPIFDRGIVYKAEKQKIADVNLGELRDVANELGRPNAFVLEGTTTITLNGKKMKVTNVKEGWTNKEMTIPENGMIYVKTDPQNSYEETYYEYDKKGRGKTKTRWIPNGDIFLSAPNGLDGQLTLVAEENINITDHVLYKSNPANNPNSNDKLGLIAKRDVVVKTLTPNNLSIYAHIFCKEGGFGVENYTFRPYQRELTVYGGIANEIRKAVGTINSSGYYKNYIYDTRFALDPPPHYPRRPEELEWERWEDRWEE